MFDHIHLEQYNRVHFTNTALKIFKTKKYNQGQLDNFRGYELHIVCKEDLEQQGYTNIQFEVDILTTKVDVEAELNNEKHSFECKACDELNCKVIKQIKKHVGHYKNVHVFVPSDAHISYRMSKAIKDNNADVVRASITHQELKDRVSRLVN